MGVTEDSALMGIFKTWYTDSEIESLLFRNSPSAKKFKKTRIGGKEYKFPALYGRGGACAGSMIVAAANAALGSAKVAEFAVTPGQMFSVFNITQQEILASQNIRGAYVPMAVVKMYSATDAFRKVFASALFATGFGEIGHAPSYTTAAGPGEVVDFVDKSLVVKMDIGTVFRITNGSTPASALRTSVNTVTAINGTVVTFTSTAIETWNVAGTDWVEFDGCRNGSSPLLPVGLAAWLPTIAGRTGGTWDSYIATSFMGVDRSVAPDRLAGNYVVRNVGGNEKYSDTIVRAIEAVRTAGGDPKLIIVNSLDMVHINGEIAASMNYFSQTNTGSAAKSKNEFSRGFADMSFGFNTSWLDNVLEDPFCPRYTSYILDEDMIEFACLTNVDTPMSDGIADQAPGIQNVNGVSAPEMQYKFILDDYISEQPGANTENGPAMQVSLNMYGNWVVRAPAKCAVINFVS